MNSELFISDPDPGFYLSKIPVPGAKKAPDPGSWSATLAIKVLFINVLYNIKDKFDCFFLKFSRVERLGMFPVCSYFEIDPIQNQIRKKFFFSGSRSSFTNNSGCRIYDILSRDSWLSASTSITIPPGSAALLEASLVLETFWQKNP